MTDRSEPNGEREPRETRRIRSELNLMRWICLFATSKYRGRSREVWRRLQEDKRIGVIVGKQPDDRGRLLEVGVLRVRDLLTVCALIQLWEWEGRPSGELTHGFGELSRILKTGRGRKDYRLHEESLKRLFHIPVIWVGSFYQKETETLETVERGFRILTTLEIYTRTVRGRLKEKAFTWRFHERLLSNLLWQYTKPFRLDVLTELSGELAVLCYAYLDLLLAGRTELELTTRTLFEELKIEGKRYRYPSVRRQSLEPVVAELQGVKLSTGTLEEIRLERTQSGEDWKLVLRKRPFRKGAEEAEVRALVEELVRVLGDERSRGLYVKLARRALEEPRLLHLLYRCLSEVKEEWREGLIRTSKGAVFVDKLKRYCRERGIDLGLKGSAPPKSK